MQQYFPIFANAAIEVLTTMAGIEATASEFTPSQSHNKTWGDVTGLVALPGVKASGFMSISFEKDCILGIVSALIGESHDEINSSVSDASGELTNMISSVARSKLTEQGIELGMALPFTVIGKNVAVDTAMSEQGYATIISTKFGSFQIAVLLAKP